MHRAADGIRGPVVTGLLVKFTRWVALAGFAWARLKPTRSKVKSRKIRKALRFYYAANLRGGFVVTQEFVTLDCSGHTHVALLSGVGAQNSSQAAHANRAGLCEFMRQGHHDFHR